MKDRRLKNLQDRHLGTSTAVPDFISLTPNVLKHIHNDQQGDRTTPCPCNPDMHDVPKGAMIEHLCKGSAQKKDNNGGPLR